MAAGTAAPATAGMAQVQQQLAATHISQHQHLPGAVPSSLSSLDGSLKAAAIDFADLEFRRVIGTGQFGLVRVVRHVKTDEVYALKVTAPAALPCRLRCPGLCTCLHMLAIAA